MLRIQTTLVCVFVLSLTRLCIAQSIPDTGPGTYPQFRNLSGLAGSGFGTDENGNHSLGGPVAFSTPTAYVLGHNHFEFLYGGSSFDNQVRFGTNRTNETAFGMIGVTIGKVNLAGTFFVKSRALDQVFHLQAGYTPSNKIPLALSLGVQDIQGRGGSAGDGQPTDHLSSQSFFGVATYRIATHDNPVYISAGYGGRRFHSLFGSASYQVARRIRVYVEEDVYTVNEGAVFGWKVGHGRTSAFIEALAGFQHYTRPSFGIGVGF